MKTQIISSVHSRTSLCHISDGIESKESGHYYYNTRCGMRLQNPWTDFRSSNRCSRCGDDNDYQAIAEAAIERHAAQARQQAREYNHNQARLALRNEQRRRLAPAIQQALEQIGAQMELEYQLHGAKLTGSFSVDGQEHHFSTVLKR